MTIKRAKGLAKDVAIAWVATAAIAGAATAVSCGAAYAVAHFTVTKVTITEPPHRVATGETVWTIASEIANRHADKPINVGALAYAIEKENNVQNSLIRPGQTLIIPEDITF